MFFRRALTAPTFRRATVLRAGCRTPPNIRCRRRPQLKAKTWNTQLPFVCTRASCLHSSSETFAAAIVHRILLVSVESMFALTPLPSPSASTRVAPPSSDGIISTLSPQSSSFFLFSDTYPYSKTSIFFLMPQPPCVVVFTIPLTVLCSLLVFSLMPQPPCAVVFNTR